MPLTLLQFTPYDLTEKEMNSCTGCGHEIEDCEVLRGLYKHPDFGLIIMPPEQLCSNCVTERVQQYHNNHFNNTNRVSA